MQDIKAILRGFLLDNFVMEAGAEIADDASFIEGHILDSTGFIELVTFVEKTFNLKVPDDDLVPENFDSIAIVERYLTRRGAAA